MKKIFGIFLIASALFAGTVSAQTNAVVVPMKSNGGHTTNNAGGVNSWSFATLGYDTISNADTNKGVKEIGSNFAMPGGVVRSNLVIDSVKLSGNYASGSIQCTFLKVSGTPADTAVLQVSDDGITWLSSGQDTMLITNVTYTQIHIWQLPGRVTTNAGSSPSTALTAYPFNIKSDRLPFLYYRVYVRTKPATIQSAIVKCVFVGRTL